jgi:hypothetical protein
MSSGTLPIGVPSRKTSAPVTLDSTRMVPPWPPSVALSSPRTLACWPASTCTVCFHGIAGSLRTSTTCRPSMTSVITIGVVPFCLLPSR